ncbi:flagellar assembly protein FliX [Erythrobacter aureus]|uniref:Flagellar trans-acting factor FliX n=1 Tax=Erythrobacter aureus TaxID=2182384 RepID=A0A345YID7_9SPHN|nr:flagellar assembly protein FliX [Erythrobacter aureus]AXK43689.1 flagellar trans-acting factor FliX [Erythrobacter aureus]
MRIGPILPIPRLLAAMAVKPEPFAGKEEHTAPAPSATAQPQPGQPLGSLQMVLTLAAFDPEREKRRQMAERGRRGLDQLEALQRELMAGEPTPERLEQLIEWVKNAEAPSDPNLASIFSDIELRVRVELAKLDIEI